MKPQKLTRGERRMPIEALIRKYRTEELKRAQTTLEFEPTTK